MNAAATQVGRRSRGRSLPVPALDYWLLTAALVLLGMGLVMVASASMPVADRNFDAPFHYVIRHGIALSLGLISALALVQVPVAWWEKSGGPLLFLGLVLLVLVLVPGLGRTVNGATRWIPLGPFNLQSSEFMKFFTVIYLSGYLVRRSEEVSNKLSGFLKPMLLMGIASALIMAQPDFGTTAVILATVLGLLFLGGVPVWQFGALLGTVAAALAALILAEPYRLQRITSFLNPWDDPFGSGFQLIQALIAFGRGEWLGVGLGNGIQKQFYLPEAHTDFLMAVVGEEFGLVGTLLVIALLAFVTWRAFHIGAQAEQLGQRFAALVAYGFGLGLGLQAFVNVGVSMGLLPTKGLTLPFLSYGSNSIIVACMAVALLLRIDWECRRQLAGSGGSKSWRHV